MSKRSRKSIFVYVLRLIKGDKYYVGQSRNLPDRLKKHFNCKASLWTQLHTPLEVVKTVELDTASSTCVTATEIENRLTSGVWGSSNAPCGESFVFGIAFTLRLSYDVLLSSAT